MLELFAQAASGTPQPVDWTNIAVVYGPFLAGVGILLKMHRDFVYNTIPRALRAIRRELRASREANQDCLDMLLELDACKNRRGAKMKPRRRRGRDQAGDDKPRRQVRRKRR